MPKKPPAGFTERLVRTAQDVVTDVASIAVETINKVDADNKINDDYKAADLIESTAEIVNKTLKRGIDFADATLKEQPDIGKLFDAERVEDVATGMVADAKEVVLSASRSVDEDSYTAGGAFKAMTKLGRVAVAGGIELAQTTLGREPSSGTGQVADHMAFVIRRMVNQAARVAEVVADKVDDNAYKPDDWVKAMFKLADITIMGAIELAETAIIGPATSSREPIESDPFDADQDVVFERTLKLSDGHPLKRKGTGPTVNEIADRRVRFLPGVEGGVPGSVLPEGVDKFRVTVDPVGLPSGVYEGAVEITRENPAGADAEPFHVQTVEVTIAL